jgi:hypothetical protein
MRIPVWEVNTNPQIDPRACRQSLSHCEALVREGWLLWVDPADKSKGCIATRTRFGHAAHQSREHKMAAGTMRAAWGMIQSGWAGPLVFQMRRERGLEAR